ncbi:MAG: aspartate aminotransferase family protein [Candidatus Schekmanbacteria bacterium]|nr:aspartate aminotransferase family protein [Candidatus Schekmanbacteria bacterium]
MNKENIKDDVSKYLMNTYKRYPLCFTHGDGVYLYDLSGKKYLDCISGIGVNALGYGNRQITERMKTWGNKPLHTSNLFCIESQVELARILIEESFPGKVFFANSGAEANEAAIKLARKYSLQKYGSENRYEIITMKNSFHGRTFATMSATGQDKIKAGYSPLLPGFRHVDFNDGEGLLSAIDKNTCAVMVEPVQGEGGVVVANNDYLKELRQICNEWGILLIYDEVQTGIGRTGKMFAYSHFDIEPDIIALAKGLGGGLPLGAIVAKDDVAAAFSPGDHASTFGGNPLSCALGVEVLNQLRGGILENCKTMGVYFKEKLNGLMSKHKGIKQVRGLGLMLGVEFQDEATEIVNKCLNDGLLVNCTKGNVIRFLPPLIIKEEEIEEAMIIFENHIFS